MVKVWYRGSETEFNVEIQCSLSVLVAEIEQINFNNTTLSLNHSAKSLLISGCKIIKELGT